ncbi:baseplate (plasmid) [Raoultella ornithinolytica]|uniref:baseplate n=1 Tax=Raoultella ornithinolytica TaxID=54291 RepID=UPI00292BA306|nr:baseplate [Raoultella ornithinolytica]MDV1094976.1 baseplate [Raoultella ornithinolytica]MDV1122680.1 baseplate [Raoultella ornithinolytica]MDV1893195.1 baseplate [Raoultella ornithinolytica]
MNTKTILARTGEWQTRRTGKNQTTGLKSVDEGIAMLISGLFSNVLLVDPRPEEKRFASFLGRSPADRVFVGRYDGAIEFLKAIRRANAGQGRMPTSQEINRDALPAINISRSMDISYDNNDHQMDRRIGAWFHDPDSGMPLANLEYIQAILTYDVTLIATDKDTLSLMCNALGAQIRLMMGTQFEAQTSLVRVPVSLICAIQDAKEIGFSDVSAPMNEERIYAVQAPVTVNAEVITAWEVDANRVTTETSLSMG